MKHYLPSIVLALVGMVFLIAWAMKLINGEPLSFSPALATGIGLILGAIVALFIKRKPASG